MAHDHKVQKEKLEEVHPVTTQENGYINNVQSTDDRTQLKLTGSSFYICIALGKNENKCNDCEL